MTSTPQAVRDDLIKTAQGLPSLIQAAETADTPLANFLKGKSLAQSWTVYVVILTPVVSSLATHYGLGWDDATCGAVATVLTSLAAILMRTITSTPITGVITPKPPTT